RAARVPRALVLPRQPPRGLPPVRAADDSAGASRLPLGRAADVSAGQGGAPAAGRLRELRRPRREGRAGAPRVGAAPRRKAVGASAHEVRISVGTSWKNP